MVELPESLRLLLAQQDQVTTRRQLVTHKVSKAAIRWNAGRSWRVILPNTFVLESDRPTERQRRIGALLYAGGASALAGLTSAAEHGLKNANPRGRVQVVVPGSQASRVRGYVDIRRSLLDDDHQVVRGVLRLSSVARSCVDGAVEEPIAKNRTALLVEAVQRNFATVDELAEWCYRLRTRESSLVLPSLEVAASGVWSLPEAEVLELMSSSAVLPEPMTNPSLLTASGKALITPDLWLDDVAMAVMVHSREYHSTGKEFVDTIDRDAELVAAGVAVLGVTPSGTRKDPGETLRRIEAAYFQAQKRERPHVRALPRAA